MTVETLKIENIEFTNYYLINSDILYELQQEKIPFTAISMNNDKVPVRLLERLKLEFVIMAENQEQVKDNYNKLKSLLSIIKPKYTNVAEQYFPDKKNFSGLFEITFAGLPRKKFKLHLTSFSYQFDKELGFVKLSIGKKKKFLPISYTINLEGNLILPIDQNTYIFTD